MTKTLLIYDDSLNETDAAALRMAAAQRRYNVESFAAEQADGLLARMQSARTQGEEAVVLTSPMSAESYATCGMDILAAAKEHGLPAVFMAKQADKLGDSPKTTNPDAGICTYRDLNPKALLDIIDATLQKSRQPDASVQQAGSIILPGQRGSERVSRGGIILT